MYTVNVFNTDKILTSASVIIWKCHYFSEKPPSLERLEARLLLGNSRELCTEDSPPLLLELLLLLLLDEGLLELSMGVWSSTLNLAVAVTLVTLPAP